MKLSIRIVSGLAFGLFSVFSARVIAFEAMRTEVQPKYVVADAMMLNQVGATLLAVNKKTGVALAKLTSDQEALLSDLNHKMDRCAGFEAIGIESLNPTSFKKANFIENLTAAHIFGQLEEQDRRNRRFRPNASVFESLVEKPEIRNAVASVDEANLRSSVEFLSSFPTRDNRESQPNLAIEALRQRIEHMLKTVTVPYQIDFIAHRRTRQKSLRVRLIGAKRPSEILVFGAHADSINRSFSNVAPGADDDASGSANVLEALRIISQQPQSARTIDFFWYAGEESGLLGSSEIARDYKANKADVIAAVQFDMTLHPGDGEFVMGSMTDYTSAWFRSYFESINSIYVKARIVDDKCGYGCSDHASWYRQGYATLMPFEASFRNMNHNLHTRNDVINSMSSFRHSAMFSKVAVAIALDLGNSTLRSNQ